MTLVPASSRGATAAGATGLPTGWTQDAANPANVETHGGSLQLDTGTLHGVNGTQSTTTQANLWQLFDSATGEAVVGVLGSGTPLEVQAATGGTTITATAATGGTAISIVSTGAGSVAMSAGTLRIINLAAGTTATDAARFGQILPVSTVTATGDLIVGTGNGTVGRLAIGTTGQVLSPVAGTEAWKTRAFVLKLPNNPTGTTSATFTMQGLATTATSGAGNECLVTPVATGVIMVAFSGTYANTIASVAVPQFFSYRIRFGTGTPPNNGDTSPSGGAATSGPTVGVVSPNAIAFSIVGAVTGQALGTQLWFDLQVNNPGAGGTSSVGMLTFTAVEL